MNILRTLGNVRIGTLANVLPALALLASCTEFNAAMSTANSYSRSQITAQVANIQGVNDNAALVWAETGCALPYGEVVRNGSGNPNLAQAVMLLCGTPAGTTVIHTSPTATAITTVPTATVVAPVPLLVPQNTTKAP